jgi:hypothetical protein
MTAAIPGETVSGNPFKPLLVEGVIDAQQCELRLWQATATKRVSVGSQNVL